MTKPRAPQLFVCSRPLPSRPFTGDDEQSEMLSFQCIVMQGMEITGMT